MKLPIKTGTRSSRLALIQTETALRLLREKLPGLEWELVPFSSPGDRDKTADLTVITKQPTFIGIGHLHQHRSLALESFS